ncbi:hypothetical protein H8M03_10310 [Sphingomonas sabuli]|uniref:NgoFVII family restriction endonuclease n=1 Tax=Sphingomonas sabuli TaxID=2764186 RepID=A0A7G9L198_9SPHN|nr:hypothetical protein [Sphingomonas sabuli]QNM82397.1 hypothetical protein H8M03_10310 [Sphingomonas sabuli]
MSPTVRMLFDTPQREIAPTLRDLYRRCSSASMITGFMTVEGAKALHEVLAAEPAKLKSLVVGAGTWRAFDAFESLLGVGVPKDRLRVHLGHSRPTGASAKFGFYRYHPMLHSKVYYFELPNSQCAAVVGSHNLTGFALHGLNGEAATLIEGPADHDVFVDIREHISTADRSAVEYDPTQREAYAWWAAEFMEGLASKFDDLPREGEFQRTIIIVAEAERSLPSRGDTIYFELPAVLGKMQSLRAEVHLYVFDQLPSDPSTALEQLSNARKAFWCKTVGIEDDQGGREFRADWHITDSLHPIVRRTVRPFRPQPAPDMQQVRVKVVNKLFGAFDYVFDIKGRDFEPLFDTSSTVQVAPAVREELHELELIPPEDQPWFKVVGFQPKVRDEDAAYKEALSALTPESGRYVLMSALRRKK